MLVGIEWNGDGSMCPETFTEEELTETRLCGDRGKDGDREAILSQKLRKTNTAEEECRAQGRHHLFTILW